MSLRTVHGKDQVPKMGTCESGLVVPILGTTTATDGKSPQVLKIRTCGEINRIVNMLCFHQHIP